MHREYAIGWGTLALINAGLAQGKRRSGLTWFLVSLLLGPIATFLLVVLGELAYADVATIVGVPVGTVRSRVNRARSSLRELLGPAEAINTDEEEQGTSE